MRYLIFSLVCFFCNPIQAQLLSALVEVLNPIYEAFSDPDYNNRFQQPPPGQFPGGRFDGGTPAPVATGRDELLPSDCGRHPHDGTGKLCFPDGLLCRNRKFAMWFFGQIRPPRLFQGWDFAKIGAASASRKCWVNSWLVNCSMHEIFGLEICDIASLGAIGCEHQDCDLVPSA